MPLLRFILHNEQYLEKKYRISINKNVRQSIEKILKGFQVTLQNKVIQEILTKLDTIEKEAMFKKTLKYL